MMNSEKYPLFKFIIIGESGVGKSCLLLRYTKDDFASDYNVTIGVEFSSKTVDVDDNTKVKLQIWDTAGQESFRSIVRSFYRNVSAVFLVYNITKKETFEKLEEWLSEARENANERIVTVLVGAQNDREEEREVSYEEGKAWMEKKDVNLFFETSSKSNTNVELAFCETAKLVFLQHVTQSIQKRQSEQKNSISLSECNPSGQHLLNEDEEKKTRKRCC